MRLWYIHLSAAAYRVLAWKLAARRKPAARPMQQRNVRSCQLEAVQTSRLSANRRFRAASAAAALRPVANYTLMWKADSQTQARTFVPGASVVLPIR
jgi:hypothetical protein